MNSEESHFKLQYLTCTHDQHEGQSLNMVCVQRNCKQSGLICSLCREQHPSHRIIPLKVVLANLKSKICRPLQSDQYCDKLEELQNLKQTMLYDLKCCVEQAAEQFKSLEQDIIDIYTKIKVEIIEQIQLSMQINDLLASTLHGPTDQEDYLSNFHKLSKWVNEKDKELSFNLNLSEFIVPYRKKQENLNLHLASISKIIKTELCQFGTREVQKTIEKPIETKLKYRFSSTLKGSSIVVDEQRKKATQQNTASTRFALVEEGMGLKERSIVFKIIKLTNWVGVGVCLKDRISAVNYAFKYENLGHGSYLLSNNGYTWSHSATEDNIHPCFFTFKQGSIIEVALSATEIVFKLRDNNTFCKMKIDYKEEEWANVCFCANLCSENDSIQILDE